MQRHLSGFFLIVAGAALLALGFILRLALPETFAAYVAPLNLAAGACVGVGLVRVFRNQR